MTRLVTLVLAVCLSMAASAGVAGTAHARSERPAVASKATNYLDSLDVQARSRSGTSRTAT